MSDRMKWIKPAPNNRRKQASLGLKTRYDHVLEVFVGSLTLPVTLNH